jgi:hypothetical protein
MLFFWLLLLAHGVADFILQTAAVSSAKCQNKWRGYFWHGAAVFACTLLAIHFYGWRGALLAAALVTAVHLALDWLKNKGRALCSKVRKREARPGVPGLLMDQLLHILSLLWIWRAAGQAGGHGCGWILHQGACPPGPVSRGGEGCGRDLHLYPGGLWRCGADTHCPGPGLPWICSDGQEKGVAAGKYIGILERTLILILAATGNISAIGVVFAAKSIARFSELSKKQFAEYYLVGTLLSFLLALAGGMAISTL